MITPESFHVIIPARYNSTRLPGKLLMDLGGKTILERVYDQTKLASPQSIFIATDHQEIHDEAKSFGADVVMTSSSHPTGTSRIAEVIQKLNLDPEAIVVNVQGDEPLIHPELIQQVARLLFDSPIKMSTLCWPLENVDEYHNPNIVKVVRNCYHHALYFSRSPIPAFRDDSLIPQAVYRHIGLYAYRAGFLLDYLQWPECQLEQVESLEQLRVLWQGYAIAVGEACVKPLQDVNTPEDLAKARLQFDKLNAY